MSPVEGTSDCETAKFHLYALEREVDRLREDSKSYVTYAMLDAKLAIIHIDLSGQMKALSDVTIGIKDSQAESSRKLDEFITGQRTLQVEKVERRMSGLVMPITVGLVVAIFTVLLGLAVHLA